MEINKSNLKKLFKDLQEYQKWRLSSNTKPPFTSKQATTLFNNILALLNALIKNTL